MDTVTRGASEAVRGTGSADDLLGEIESCLARVRDHIYDRRIGALIVAGSTDLFDLGPGGAGETDDAWQPTVVRAGDLR